MRLLTKSTQKKLARQIAMLAEKQYRKGFQQGYEACYYKELTIQQVDNFRHKGAVQDYRLVEDPHSNCSRPTYSIVLAESINMPDLHRLISDTLDT
jgi:hypothetical protein